MRLRPLALLAFALALAPAASATAATRYWIRGAGFGHGVGMSQYGALGFAQHGWRYDAILRHYYSSTHLGRVSTATAVRVLLVSGAGSVTLGHASAAGRRRLNPRATYVVWASGGGLALRRVGARGTAKLAASTAFTGPGGYVVLGNRAINGIARGGYRGSLVLSRDGGGVDVVDVAGVDAYTRGVVAGEMPAEWAMPALEAQAVAARTYGLTGGSLLYPDTRSQVYQGMAGETARTNAAVSATAGQVVLYGSRLATTYFFSTSGGRTKDVRYGFPGASPEPWLKSVDDPYDGVSPLHRWTLPFTKSQVSARLAGLYRGTFKGIQVLQRGFSPRIVRARVVGTRGSSVVSGPTLRTRLHAYDTWMSFTAIASAKTEPKPSGGNSGGAAAGAGDVPERVVVARMSILYGTIEDTGARPRRAVVERFTGGRWVRVAAVTVWRGAYAYRTADHGRYRVVWDGLAGPAVAL